MVGERLVLLDSAEAPIGLVKVTRVETYPLLRCPGVHRRRGREQQDHRGVAAGHRDEFAAEGTPVVDDELMVCLWFQLIDEAHGASQCGTTGVPVSNGESRGRRRLL
jgi:hypothetical protein